MEAVWGLERGRTLRIQFADAAGQPVPGAYVGLDLSTTSWRGLRSLYNILTPDSWYWGTMAEGTRCCVQIEAPGYAVVPSPVLPWYGQPVRSDAKLTPLAGIPAPDRVPTLMELAGDLIGSVVADDLPRDLAANKKAYLSEWGYGAKGLTSPAAG